MNMNPKLLYFISIIAIILYLYFLIISLIKFDETYIEKFLSLLLIIINAFFIIHSIEYLHYYINARTFYEKSTYKYFNTYFNFETAVFIASYNESETVLEDTLIACINMSKQANGIVYVLDDSTDIKKAKAIKDLCMRYSVNYIHRDNRRGYKAGALNDALKFINTKYFAVFDADQRPMENFLNELIPVLEDDENIALIQVPQIYDNNNTPVARGANDIQMVFYTFITEGKSLENSMFSCGSNVIYRTESIKSIGGFVETNITEDMATTIKLHERGYKTIYYNLPLVRGEAPETLNAYFIQQSRWSQGSISLFYGILKSIFSRNGMNYRQKIGYFVTTSWYFIGVVNIIMLLFPLLFIFFNVISLITPEIYIFVLAFYIIFEFFVFTATVYEKTKSIIPVLRNISLTFITSPVFVKSAFYAFINKRTSFKVTPKGDSSKIPFSGLKAQYAIMFISAAGFAYAIYRYIISGNMEFIFNGAFMLYFLLLSMSIFYYNR